MPPRTLASLAHALSASADLDSALVALAEALAEVDLVLTPTLRCVPPPAGVDELAVRETLTSLTFPFNAIGAPALAIPCGPAEGGLPTSVQLAAAPGADALVLAAGALLQRELGHTGGPRE
jgi:aspartyl-tRNA(Asn)/glutamyl-tRNA(Gln) amidotransferase subunit A